MRNFEERKAEVFLRSKKRMNERKKRRDHILAFCVPLCLIGMLAAFLMLPTNKKMPPTGGEEGGAEIAEDSEMKFTRIEVVGPAMGDQSFVLNEDPEGVQLMYNGVQACFAVADDVCRESASETLSDDLAPESGGNYAQYATTTLSDGYRIVFSGKSGAQEIYFLSKDKLINAVTKEEVRLTEEKRLSLLELLGLTVSEESK